MNKYLLMATTFSLAMMGAMMGCSSSSTIHLNKLYLDESLAESIQDKLKEKGFHVETNQHEYPEDITSTSIVYSPFADDAQVVNKVKQVLNEFDIDIDTVNSLVASNHWYTKNTLGLYIVPADVAVHSGRNIGDLAKMYESSECAAEIKIDLKPNGAFEYLESGNEKLNGTWSITSYPYILLENEAPYLHYYFEVEVSELIDAVGKVNITSLKHLSSSLLIEKCTMSYGVRA